MQRTRAFGGGLAMMLMLDVFGMSHVRGDVPALETVGPRVRSIIGKDALPVLLHAERAEVYRLDEVPPSSTVNAGELIAGYHPLARPRAVEDVVREELVRTLLDPDTYRTYDLRPGTGIGKMCGPFQPGVAVRFWSPRSSRTHVDVLLSFHCGDMALVTGKSGKRIFPQDIQPSYERFLRLAASALPEDRALRERLEQIQQEHAREMLFTATFPPHVQTLLLNASWNEDQNDRTGAVLRREVPPIDLFVLAAQAFGIRRGDWRSSDSSVDVVVRAVRGAAASDLVTGLQQIAHDQVALAGAAELLGRGALDALPPEVAHDWKPRLLEAAAVQSPLAPMCEQLPALAVLPDRSGLPLIRRVATGALPTALSRYPPYAWSAISARACALMALAGGDPSAARDIAAKWAPADPVDAAAIKAVAFRLGDVVLPAPAVFEVSAPEVGTFVVNAIRAHPTLERVDFLVARGIGSTSGVLDFRAREAFTALTGFSFDVHDLDDTKCVAAARTWWHDHKANWRPRPSPAAR